MSSVQNNPYDAKVAYFVGGVSFSAQKVALSGPVGIQDDQVRRGGLVLSLKDRTERSWCLKSDTPRKFEANGGKAIAPKPVCFYWMLFEIHQVSFSVLCLMGLTFGSEVVRSAWFSSFTISPVFSQQAISSC